MIYTASSQAMACLENVVHRSGEGLNALFKVMIIHLPDELRIEAIAKGSLPENWFEFTAYPQCQQQGDTWLEKGSSAVLKVPSAVVPLAYNYLLNPAHPDFARITLQAVADFVFDPRIKQ